MKRYCLGLNKKNVSVRLVFLLVIISQLYGQQTNKTHISLQHQRPRRAMLAGHGDVWTMKSEDRLDGSLLATSYFYGGLNGKNLGRTLGINNNSTITVKPNTQGSVDSRFMLRTPGNVSTSEAMFDLSYFAKHAGVMFSWFQHLDGIEEGFYCAFHMPVVVSHHQIKLDIVNQVLDENAKGSITDYLAGKEGKRIAGNLSEMLMFGKIIKGHHIIHGIADIELLLGYNFLYDSPHHLGFDFSIIFPTGTKKTGAKLFEPVVGSQQYTVGMGVNGYGRMLRGKRHRLYGYFDTNLYFVMKGFEKRMLGIKEHPFGQYYLAAKREGSGATDIPFFPASHILTRDVKVNSLYIFEGACGFAYGYSNFTFDVGYNLYHRSKEKISLKDEWNDYEYVIPQPNVTTNQVITSTPADVFLPLNKDVIDCEAAASGEQLTHSVYVCFSHTSFEADYPLTLAGGALYEHANDPQSALTGYQIFFKAGVSF